MAGGERVETLADGRSGRIRFDDLTLYQASFEARYPNAFLLWDHSGVIWSDIIRKWPDMKLRHAEPNKIIFDTVGTRETQLTLELTRLIVSTVRPDKALDEFIKIADLFTGAAINYLNLTQFSRVGLRILFTKEYDKPELAASALLATGLVSVPVGAHFGVSTPPIATEYYIRRDDGVNGYNLRLKTETLNVELKPDFGVGDYVRGQNITKERILLDTDCYIGNTIPVEKLALPDWLSQTFHVIKRDSRKFLGE